MASLNTQLQLSLSAALSSLSTVGQQNQQLANIVAAVATLAQGTGLDQADVVHASSRSLNNAAEIVSLAAGPVVPNPTLGPTVAASGSGATLATGNWSVAFSYTTPRGETQVSPATVVAITLGQNIVPAAVTPLPSGATGVNWYISQAVGSATLKFSVANSGGSPTITAAPAGGANTVPAANTARGKVLLDPQGNEITMGHLKVMAVAHRGTVNGDLLRIGGAAVNPANVDLDTPAAKKVMDAGGVKLFWERVAGFPVVLNTSDQLKFDATGSTQAVSFDLLLIGTST